MAPAALAERVQGLGALLETAKLLPYKEAAEAWCDAVGAVEAAELVEAADEFADALGLKLMERRRLLKVAASWTHCAADIGPLLNISANAQADKLVEPVQGSAAEDEPLPEPVVGSSTTVQHGYHASSTDQSNDAGQECSRGVTHETSFPTGDRCMATESDRGEPDTVERTSFYGTACVMMSAAGSFYGSNVGTRSTGDRQEQPVCQASAEDAATSVASYYTSLPRCGLTDFSVPLAEHADDDNMSRERGHTATSSTAGFDSIPSATRPLSSASYDGLAELLDHDLVLAALAEAENLQDAEALHEAIARAEVAGISVLRLQSARKALTALELASIEELAKQRRIELRKSKEAKWNYGGHSANTPVNDRVREHEAELEQHRVQAYRGRGRFRFDAADEGEEKAHKYVAQARRELELDEAAVDEVVRQW